MAQPASYVETLQSLLPATSNAGNEQHLQATTLTNTDNEAQAKVIPIFGIDFTAPHQHIHDCDRLTEAELKKKYKAEWQSWRSRRSSAKKNGLPFHQPWDEFFSTFLRHHGPIPATGHTLDKVNPKLGYVPGNTRWASKKEQTWNRPNTKWIVENDLRLPLGVWADLHNIKRRYAYQKHKDGWLPSEILAGKREHGIQPTALIFNRPWPLGDERKWEAKYKDDVKGRTPDRLTYLISESRIQLRQLDDEQEEVWFPDDYDANIEEAGRLARHEYLYKFYSRALRHGTLQLTTSKKNMF